MVRPAGESSRECEHDIASGWWALARRPQTRVALVNQRAEFVERIRMHQFAAGRRLPTIALAQLSGRGINVVVDRVTLSRSQTFPVPRN